MPEFKDLVKNLYGKYGKDLTADKEQYILNTYSNKPEEFVTQFYGKYHIPLDDSKLDYIRSTYLSGAGTAKEPSIANSSLSVEQKKLRADLKTALRYAMKQQQPHLDIDTVVALNNATSDKNTQYEQPQQTDVYGSSTTSVTKPIIKQDISAESNQNLQPILSAGDVVADNKYPWDTKKEKKPEPLPTEYNVSVSSEAPAGTTGEKVVDGEPPLTFDPQPQTLRDYLNSRNISLSDIGYDSEANTSRNLYGNEIESLDKKLEIKAKINEGWNKRRLDEINARYSTLDKYVGGTARSINEGTAGFLRTLDGADRLFADATGIGYGGWFNKAADFVEDVGVKGRPMTPDNIAGNTLHTLGNMTQLFLELSVTPKLFNQQIVTQLAASGFLNTYREKDIEGAPAKEKIVESLKQAGIGAKDGLILHSLSYPTKFMANVVGGATKSQLAGTVAGVGTNASGFAGIGIVTDYLEGRPFDKKKAEEEFVVGAALGGREIAERASARFYASSPMAIRQALSVPRTAMQLRSSAMKIRESVIGEKNSDVVSRANIAADMLDGVADIKSQAKDIAKNPSSYNDAIIANENIPQEAKEAAIDKVNIAAEASNPSYEKVRSINEKIQEKKRELEYVDNNSELPSAVKGKKIAEINEYIAQLERDVVASYEDGVSASKDLDVAESSGKTIAIEEKEAESKLMKLKPGESVPKESIEAEVVPVNIEDIPVEELTEARVLQAKNDQEFEQAISEGKISARRAAKMMTDFGISVPKIILTKAKIEKNQGKPFDVEVKKAEDVPKSTTDSDSGTQTQDVTPTTTEAPKAATEPIKEPVEKAVKEQVEKTPEEIAKEYEANKDKWDEEAKGYGFRNMHHALQSVNNRGKKQYKRYQDIDKAELQKVSEQRAKEQEKVAKSTKLTERQKKINDISDKVSSYNALKNGRLGKGTEAGTKLRNEIEIEAKELGFTVNVVGQNGYIALRNERGNKPKVVREMKNSDKTEDFIPITERSQEVQDVIEKISEFGGNAMPRITGFDGRRLSDRDINNALKDIAEGKNTIRSNEVMNQVEDMMSTGDVKVFDKASGETISISKKDYLESLYGEDFAKEGFTATEKEMPSKEDIVEYEATVEPKKIEEGVPVTDEKGNKGTITSVNKEGVATVEYEDGTTRKKRKEKLTVAEEQPKMEKVEEPKKSQPEPEPQPQQEKPVVAKKKTSEPPIPKQEPKTYTTAVDKVDQKIAALQGKSKAMKREDYQKQLEALRVERRAAEIEDAKGKIKDGIDGLIDKFGGKKDLIGNPLNDTTIFEDVVKIYKGASEIAQIKIEDFVDMVKRDFKGTLDDKHIDEKAEELYKAVTEKPRKSRLQSTLDKETGITRKKDAVTVNEYSALKDQLKLEASTARKATAAEKKRIEALQSDARSFIKENFSSDMLQKDPITKQKLTQINKLLQDAGKDSKNFAKLADAIEEMVYEKERRILSRDNEKIFKRFKPKKEKLKKQRKLNKSEYDILDTSDILYHNDVDKATNKTKQLEAMLKSETLTESERTLAEAQVRALEFVGSKDAAELERGELLNKDIDSWSDKDYAVYDMLGMVGSKDMSVCELREVNANLKSLIETGRTKRKWKENIDKQRIDEIRNDVLDVLTGGGEKKPLTEAEKTKAKKTLDGFIGALTTYRTKQESLVTLMDFISRLDKKSNPMEGKLVELANELSDASVRKNRGVKKMLEGAATKAAEIFGDKFEKKMKSNAKEKGITLTVYDADGKPTEKKHVMSKNQAYHYYQIYEQAVRNNNQAMLDTFDKMGWSDKTIDQLVDYMTDGGKDMSLKKWADWQLEEFYPFYYSRINDAYKNKYGVDLPYNEFYVPSFRVSSKAGEYADILESKNYTQTTVNGSLKSRTGSSKEFLKIDGDKVLVDHIRKMEHFINMDKPISDFNKVFKDKSIRDVISQFHGKGTNKVIDGFVEDITRGKTNPSLRIGAIDQLRKNFITSKIALNIPVFLKQLTSEPAYMGGIKTEQIPEFLKYKAEFWTNPIKNAKKLLGTDYMKDRYDRMSIETDLAEIADKQNLGNIKSMSFRDKLMILARLGDAGAIIGGGYPYYKVRYNEYLKSGLSKSEADRRALKDFERQTRLTQQSGELQDLSHIQRWGTLGKTATMFQNSPLQYFRMEMNALTNLAKGRGSRVDNIKNFVIYHFILPGLFQAVSSGLTGSDKNDWIRTLGLGSLGYAFITGDMVEALYDELTSGKSFGVNFLPKDMADEIIKSPREIKEILEKDPITEEDIIKASSKAGVLLGDFTGLPLGNVERYAEGAYDYMTDRTDNELRLLGFSDYTLGESNLNNSETALIKRHSKEGSRRNYNTMLKEAKEYYGDKYKYHESSLKKRWNIYKEFGFDDDNVNELMKPATNKKKAELLVSIKEELGADFGALYNRWKRYKVVSDKLDKEFNAMLTGKKVNTSAGYSGGYSGGGYEKKGYRLKGYGE